MNEEALIVLAQKGDDEAFYSLISAYKHKLYNTAYCYFKDEQDSLEAVQEITCRAFVKLKKLKEPKYFGTWLTRIMINYCIDEMKRKKKTVPMEKEHAVEENGRDINRLILEAAIEKLEPKYKKVIMMKYFHDMTVSDMAGVLECPEGTVKTWTSRALKQLKDMISQGDDYGV